MNKTKRIIIAGLLACVFIAGICVQAKADPYEDMVKKFSKSAVTLSNRKIAVIPFSYVDGRKSSAGVIISERITTQLVNQNAFEVVERAQLEKVMKELNLQSSGIMNEQTTKEIGKILGVEAIITGSLIAKKQGVVEVNARLISTETAKVIAAHTMDIPKDWMEEGEREEPSYADQPYGQPAVSEPYYAPRTKGKNEYDFIEIFYTSDMPGSGMNLKFSNSGSYGVKLADIGITGSTLKFTTVEENGIPEKQTIPALFRFGSIMNYFGIGMEFFFHKYSTVASQGIATIKKDGVEGSLGTIDDYILVTTFGFALDLMVNVPVGPVDIYGGGALGMSMNSYYTECMLGFTQSTASYTWPCEESLLIGFCYRFPMVGARIHFNDYIGCTIEYSYLENMFDFTRGIESENDTLKTSIWQLQAGVSFFMR